MSYTPPAGNAVNFTDANSALYSAPPATAVNFTTYGTSHLAAAYAPLNISGSAALSHGVNTQATGQLIFGGSSDVQIPSIAYGTGSLAIGGSLTLSIPFAGAGYGGFTLYGSASGEHVQPHFYIIGTGALTLGGAGYDKGFVYTGSGRIKFAGSASAVLGSAIVASGKLAFNGGADGAAGRAMAGGAKIILLGAAIGKRGQSGQLGGLLSLGGTASLAHRAQITVTGSGALHLAGAAEILTPQDYMSQCIYASSKQRVFYALQ